MTKHLSVLRRFRIEDDCYGEGASLVHDNKRCDWREDAYGMSLPQLIRLADAHARACDGKRKPLPEVQPGPPNPYLPAIWMNEISRALQTNLVAGGPSATVSADGGG